MEFKKNFTQVSNDTILKLNGNELKVYCVMQYQYNYYTRKGNNYFRSYEDLANDTGFSVRQTKTIIKSLIESGWVSKTKGGRKKSMNLANVYIVNDSAVNCTLTYKNIENNGNDSAVDCTDDSAKSIINDSAVNCTPNNTLTLDNTEKLNTLMEGYNNNGYTDLYMENKNNVSNNISKMESNSNVMEMVVESFNNVVTTFNTTVQELKKENTELKDQVTLLNDRLNNAGRVIKEMQKEIEVLKSGNNRNNHITSTPVKESNTVPSVSNNYNNTVDGDVFGNVLNILFNKTAPIKDRKDALLKGIEMRDNGMLTDKQAATITKAVKSNSKLLVGTNYNTSSTVHTSGTTENIPQETLDLWKEFGKLWNKYQVPTTRVMFTKADALRYIEVVDILKKSNLPSRYMKMLNTCGGDSDWNTNEIKKLAASEQPQTQTTHSNTEVEDKSVTVSDNNSNSNTDGNDDYGKQFEGYTDGNDVMEVSDNDPNRFQDEDDAPF